MTATIDPRFTPVVNLRDPRTRLWHYAAAILLWMKCCAFKRVAICENSGNADKLECVVDALDLRDRIDVLAYDGNEGSWVLGKGYGEGGILRYALKHWAPLAEADTIWKITGRLFVANIAEILAAHVADPNVMRPGDTRLFKVSRKFFVEHLLDVYLSVNDNAGTSIEVAYERALALHREAGLVVPFNPVPIYVGQDAGSGNWHEKFDHETIVRAQTVAIRAMP
jgi:hypothetical protein